jgi:hypothetical protein
MIPHRYLGLELAGAKNQKTAIATIEYYPKEKKIFLLDIYDRISASEDQTGDEALLDILREAGPSVARIGVNVPLELPACITCTRKTCPLPAKCVVPAVKWMRMFTRRAYKNPSLDIRVKEFTPYTQRPFELWARYQLIPQLSEESRFDVDETLGGNKAPLTARMHFLKMHLRDFELIEAWPKLTVAILTADLQISRRIIASYRHLDNGAHARVEILEALSEKYGIFIYERDLRKLSHSLTAFDSFICSYTALLSDNEACTRPPNGFPVTSGWVQYPKGT